MQRILAGIETEYGLYIEGRGAEEQVEDATAFVRSYPGERLSSWDYRYESPRADLRGFAVSHLQYDPVDARFDRGRDRGSDSEVRADQVLWNGARFYNDHGHPEYATPEAWGLRELARQDEIGQHVLSSAASAYSSQTGLKAHVYKNNTDFHGASYGTHESYLVPREIGFERLYRAVMPILVARQVLCGAGKVGSDAGKGATYQLSQRADFFVEPFNTETLYRRPVFNTRDEPHGDPDKWIRLHVISGDANMIPSATARKVGLVKLALLLEQAGEAPQWRIRRPVEAFKEISRDDSYEFRIELEGGSWTTAEQVVESYLSAAEAVLGIRSAADSGSDEAEYRNVIDECRELFVALRECPERFAYSVDWAAKKQMLEQIMESEDWSWREASLRSYDLEYHNVDVGDGLFYALREMGQVEPEQGDEPVCRTRAAARGWAVRNLKEQLETACWRSLTFRSEDGLQEVELPPDRDYDASQLPEGCDVGTFIEWIGGTS